MKKGEKIRLLRDVSLSGKILEILHDIKAVGDDLRFNSGRCGKGGQLVPGDGSPHLLIEKATVGGAGSGDTHTISPYSDHFYIFERVKSRGGMPYF